MVVASADTTQVAAADQPSFSPPPRNIPTVPGQKGSDTDGPVPQSDAAPVLAAEPGNRLISAERTTLAVKTGVTADDAGAVPTRSVGAVAFTIATTKQIVETDAGMSIRIGNVSITARRFSTGHENDTPSVIKLVVPADAINAAADGASLAVVNGGQVYNFGPLAKSAIR